MYSHWTIYRSPIASRNLPSLLTIPAIKPCAGPLPPATGLTSTVALASLGVMNCDRVGKLNLKSAQKDMSEPGSRELGTYQTVLIQCVHHKPTACLSVQLQ